LHRTTLCSRQLILGRSKAETRTATIAVALRDDFGKSEHVGFCPQSRRLKNACPRRSFKYPQSEFEKQAVSLHIVYEGTNTIKMRSGERKKSMSRSGTLRAWFVRFLPQLRYKIKIYLIPGFLGARVAWRRRSITFCTSRSTKASRVLTGFRRFRQLEQTRGSIP
jgi:hypothetical protein